MQGNYLATYLSSNDQRRYTHVDRNILNCPFYQQVPIESDPSDASQLLTPLQYMLMQCGNNEACLTNVSGTEYSPRNRRDPSHMKWKSKSLLALAADERVNVLAESADGCKRSTNFYITHSIRLCTRFCDY